ncbi:MAG: bifunctional metallophosphatase/5'-nucleotidase [Bacteroidetes bacterium]|nr:MAG: bifunctional metallophosphatase/5'-nucleotidase [Bacteroidota bacterium]
MKNKILATFSLVISLILFSGKISAQEQRFTILHTSDEHSVLTPLPAVDYHPEISNPTLGGFARLSGLVKQIRAEKSGEPVLLLSSGDFIGGSPYAWLILEGYSPEIELMMQIGYDATTIGNHEFDYGPDALTEYFHRAGYPEAHEKLPLIISNLNIPDGHSLLDIGFLPHKIMELENGLKLGLFGLLGTDAYSVAPYAEPVTIFDPISIAQQQVDQLREMGADVIIALSHSGVREDREMAEKVNNIDILLGGHDHYQTLEPEIISNTILLHSSHYLRNLGMLELEFNSSTGRVRLLNDDNNLPYLIPLDHNVPEDPEITERINYYTKRLNDFVTEFSDNLFTDIYAHIMHSDFPVVKHQNLAETTVGNFVVDAMRLEAEKVTGRRVDLAIQANGVIRGDIIPGVMPWSEGKVSFLDLVTIAGLGSGPDKRPGYPMVSVYFTAEEVYNLLEVAGLLSKLMGDTYFLQISGLKYTYDPGRIAWLTIPFANIPVPAYRSVQDVKIFTGEGVQHEDGYALLDRDDPRLFHLVSDYYLTSFLPMIGEILPRLALVLKDEDGNPLDLENTILYENEREFKVWEAVARYAVSFEKGEDGLPVIPDVYRETQGRIVEEAGVPLYVWSYLILIAIIAALGFLINKGIKKIKKRKPDRFELYE